MLFGDFVDLIEGLIGENEIAGGEDFVELVERVGSDDGRCNEVVLFAPSGC